MELTPKEALALDKLFNLKAKTSPETSVEPKSPPPKKTIDPKTFDKVTP